MSSSLHELPFRNSNAKYLIPDHASMDIQVSKNDNTSYTIKVIVQTKDKRNLRVQSFIIPRDIGVPSCEVVGNKLLFFYRWNRERYNGFYTGNTRCIGLARK